MATPKPWQKILILNEDKRRMSKGDRRMQLILDKAIEYIGSKGFDELNFQEIAKLSKITRPLVNHYFSNKYELFDALVQFVAQDHQSYILSHMANANSSSDLLLNYIRGNILWVRERRSCSRVWMYFLAQAGYQKEAKLLNSQSVLHGRERILTILKEGAQEGTWNNIELEKKARKIQVMITGTVISLITEAHTDEDIECAINDICADVKELLRP